MGRGTVDDRLKNQAIELESKRVPMKWTMVSNVLSIPEECSR